jgi:hypothetical protein
MTLRNAENPAILRLQPDRPIIRLGAADMV